MEDGAGNLLQLGEDVTRRGGVLAAHATSTKLTGRGEQVDVVATDEGLGHANDGALKRGLTVVVGRVLTDITGQLSHLNLALELPLEAGKQDLTLRGLESVEDVGDGTGIVGIREQDQLLVHKVREADALLLRLGIVEEGILLEGSKPFLAVLNLALGEGHLNQLATRRRLGGLRLLLRSLKLHHINLLLLLLVVIIDDQHVDVVLELAEVDLVHIEIAEVLLGLRAGGRTKTLVVLDLPSLGIVAGGLLPRLVLGKGKERLALLPLAGLDDGGDELLQETGHVEKGGPEVMEEVDDQALDVRAIVILIRHDHQVTVAELLHRGLVVLFARLEAHDLDCREKRESK